MTALLVLGLVFYASLKLMYYTGEDRRTANTYVGGLVWMAEKGAPVALACAVIGAAGLLVQQLSRLF